MIEVNNKTKSEIDKKLIEKVVRLFLQKQKLENKEVSIAFVGDTVIRRLNKQYRKIEKVTDILSFTGEGDFLGEIIIDYAQIKRQAKKFSNTTKKELIFILVHGLLHLIGYDDRTEKDREKMIERGKEFIKNAKL